MLNWFSCRVSCAVGVISQSDRVVRRLFQRAQRVKGCHTASTLNCTHLILPILALTHTLHLSFIIILLLSLGDLTQCHSTYGKNSLLGKSDERKAKDVGKWIVMSLYTHFTWSTVNSMLLIHLCVLARFYGADSVISGGSPALEALLPHYSPVQWEILQSLGLNCSRVLLRSFV